MITIRSASLAFGDHVLFSGLDLDVGRGRLVGLTGESGCGKTSLLRAVLGFVPLTSGTIKVDKWPCDATHVHEIRRATAYVPQELQPPAVNGADLLRLTHELTANQSQVKPESVDALMVLLGLEPSLLELSAAKLSGGQRQRLLLAAALAMPKPYLLLDEPTSALDEESTQRVGQALQKACREENRAVLVVSHDSTLLTYCDRVVAFAGTSQPITVDNAAVYSPEI
ncbi:MAG: ATP-binding cassette domain-containing protein [Bacteroidales bacterium]|nr:ATP-binding cassette domain-containing protein [Bacteroidales bacterium]